MAMTGRVPRKKGGYGYEWVRISHHIADEMIRQGIAKMHWGLEIVL
jgi:hypothetical protein